MEFLRKIKWFGVGVGIATVMLMLTGAVQAGTLDDVKKRGHLRCQVGAGEPGAFFLTSDGEWAGRDVDVCRAVAAAIFGDQKKIVFQSVSGAGRFPSLANGDSDLLSRAETCTMLRETQLGLDCAGVIFYDGQGFMVKKDTGIKSVMELEGASVCVGSGVTTTLNTTDFSRTHKLNFNIVTYDNRDARNAAFHKGACDAVSNDKSGLATDRAGFPNPQDYIILPETISKEPLGPFVRQNDSDWRDIVTWAIHAMVNAEEMGINSKNVDKMRANPPSPAAARLLGVEGQLHTGLGLTKDWAYWIIKEVGNYGESYQRYMGASIPEGGVGIARKGSQNDLWTRGGLIYAPPVR